MSYYFTIKSLDKSSSESDLNMLTVTLATLAAVLLTTTVIIFILGFVCGHCCSLTKHKNTNEGSVELQTGDDLQIPQLQHQSIDMYENVQLQMTEAVTVEEQDLETSTNVAYGHLPMRQ
jgi:hypothetical protein